MIFHRNRCVRERPCGSVARGRLRVIVGYEPSCRADTAIDYWDRLDLNAILGSCADRDFWGCFSYFLCVSWRTLDTEDAEYVLTQRENELVCDMERWCENVACNLHSLILEIAADLSPLRLGIFTKSVSKVELCWGRATYICQHERLRSTWIVWFVGWECERWSGERQAV